MNNPYLPKIKPTVGGGLPGFPRRKTAANAISNSASVIGDIAGMRILNSTVLRGGTDHQSVGLAPISNTKILSIVTDTTSANVAAVVATLTTNTAGEVYPAISAELGLTEMNYSNPPRILRMKDGVFLVCGKNVGNTAIRCLMLTSNGTTVTLGNSADSALNGSIRGFHRIGDDVAVIVYVNGTAINAVAVSISSGSPVFGAAVSTGVAPKDSGDTVGRVSSCLTINNNLIVCSPSSADAVFASAATISATTISFGAAISIGINSAAPCHLAPLDNGEAVLNVLNSTGSIFTLIRLSPSGNVLTKGSVSALSVLNNGAFSASRNASNRGFLLANGWSAFTGIWTGDWCLVLVKLNADGTFSVKHRRLAGFIPGSASSYIPNLTDAEAYYYEGNLYFSCLIYNPSGSTRYAYLGVGTFV